MTPQNKATDTMALVGAIDPDAYAAGTYTTGWIEARHFNQYLGDVLVGTMGAAATVDAKIEQATSGAGAGAKDVAGKAIAQLTQAGTDDDKQVHINLSPSDLDVENGFTHFRLSVTVATQSVDMCGSVYGLFPVYGPASNHDAATVDEIVT